MPERDTIDTVGLIARRANLLRALEEADQSKRDLVETLSVSRSTVDRAVRNLEASGFVMRRDGDVTISLKGRLALSAYDNFTTDVASLEAAGAVLDPLDSTATVDISLLRGAEVVHADAVTPNRPVAALKSLLEEATAVRGFATGVLPSHVEAYYDRVVNHGTTVEFVATEAVLDEVVASYGDELEEALATGRFEVLRATRTLEYSLLIVGKETRTVVCALVYGDRGVTGVVKNDAERAVDWATSLYEELRAHAEPLAL